MTATQTLDRIEECLHSDLKASSGYVKDAIYTHLLSLADFRVRLEEAALRNQPNKPLFIGIDNDSCPGCGGNCSPECGKHPAGCFYGGFGKGFWTIAEGCVLEHSTPGVKWTPGHIEEGSA